MLHFGEILTPVYIVYSASRSSNHSTIVEEKGDNEVSVHELSTSDLIKTNN